MRLFAGPCAIESETMALDVARTIRDNLPEGLDYYFKGSFDKANRSDAQSWRGLGVDKCIHIFTCIAHEGIQTITDIHEREQVWDLRDVVDAVQIPAFLCRQTDLLKSAVENFPLVLIKKGQWVSPKQALGLKIKAETLLPKNHKVVICERGTTFGYDNLVVDFETIGELSELGSVCMDCTHCQQVNHLCSTGGRTKYAEHYAKTALLWGADSLFFEVHPNPKSANCDQSTQIALDDFIPMMKRIAEWQSAYTVV